MRASAWMVVGAMLMLGACEEEDPCGDYVGYMCDCHADDPEFDCDELRSTYENADADIEDQCAIALDDQEQADADAGLDCAI